LIALRADALEIDEVCISWRQGLWLWVASSRYTGQIVAIAVGDRSLETLSLLWSRIPHRWRKRLVYTDGYKVYPAFFAPWQHRPCKKGDGGTNTAEGVNNSLRHRCSPLVRRSAALNRSLRWLLARLLLVVEAHNKNGQKRLQRRIILTQSER
jgi:insertion element IS1 protein InsB